MRLWIGRIEPRVGQAWVTSDVWGWPVKASSSSVRCRPFAQSGPGITHMRVTLVRVKESRNITLSLPKEMLRRARILAVNRGMSLSGLLREVLGDLLSREAGYSAARRRSLRRLQSTQDLGTRGRVNWTRDSAHER